MAFGHGVIDSALSSVKTVGVWSVVLWVPQVLAVIAAAYITCKGLLRPKSAEEENDDQGLDLYSSGVERDSPTPMYAVVFR